MTNCKETTNKANQLGEVFLLFLLLIKFSYGVDDVEDDDVVGRVDLKDWDHDGAVTGGEGIFSFGPENINVTSKVEITVDMIPFLQRSDSSLKVWYFTLQNLIWQLSSSTQYI